MILCVDVFEWSELSMPMQANFCASYAPAFRLHYTELGSYIHTCINETYSLAFNPYFGIMMYCYMNVVAKVGIEVLENVFHLCMYVRM